MHLTSSKLRICTPSQPPTPPPPSRERTKRFMLIIISHSDLPQMPYNTRQFTEGIPSERPCRVCQLQLGVQWIHCIDSLSSIWIDGVFGSWRRTTRNSVFWGAVSVCWIWSLYRLSDDPYYCGEGRQRYLGNHFWGRQKMVWKWVWQEVRNESQLLAAWFQERCASSQRRDSTPEPEADGDYDLCDVE